MAERPPRSPDRDKRRKPPAAGAQRPAGARPDAVLAAWGVKPAKPAAKSAGARKSGAGTAPAKPGARAGTKPDRPIRLSRAARPGAPVSPADDRPRRPRRAPQKPTAANPHPARQGVAPGEGPQRIAKLLARAGIASRRDVERMIAVGRIALDGEVLTTPATLLASLQGVTVDGNPVAAAEPARLFLFHKPAGYLTTQRDPAGRPTIYDRLPSDLPRVMPVGRLDMTTEGLLLLTTDGALKRMMELPANGVERSYRARAFGTVSQRQLEDLIDGVEIEGMRYGRIDANLERSTGHNKWIEMTLTEGKNREVRRVVEYLGLKVNRLIRTRYGPFVLADLPAGQVVEVRADELARFLKDLKR